MKIERINDNQIRCTLSSTDLSIRNLNLGELAYGTEKARGLFRELIQKAAAEVGFEADDIPLMVEAIPLSGESVMFVITKIEDPEELDTRFSRFSPMEENDQDNWNGLTGELLEGADSLTEFLKKNLMGGMPVPDVISALQAGAPAPDAAEGAAPEHPVPITRIFRFEHLDQVTEAARVAADICTCSNVLYKKPGGSQYFLVLCSQDCDPQDFSRLCNVLSEFAEKLHQEAAGAAYCQEHYEVIIREQALQKLKNL